MVLFFFCRSFSPRRAKMTYKGEKLPGLRKSYSSSPVVFFAPQSEKTTGRGVEMCRWQKSHIRMYMLQQAGEIAMYHPTTRVLPILELLQARPTRSGAGLAERLEVD